MISLLLLGFFIGMRHAMEADHLAAVATIATRRNMSLRRALQHGMAWGLGHTITLFLFGSVVIWMDTMISEQVANYLEIAVGVMLVGLGVDVLRRLVRDRVHYHVHRHDDQIAHFHAHSHAGDPGHQQSSHDHQHGGFPLRALMIGLMHGMAGSAALILLTMETVDSLWVGLGYMLLFGLGSMVGMALLSIIIAIPMRASSSGLTWMHNSLQALVGLLTCGLGASIIYRLV
jgi:ABC-type nickel/cobalt efflux system permease component RcnA